MFHVKHMMNDYEIAVKIILEVLSGKNLSDVFNKNISKLNINVSKIKDITYGVMRYYFKLDSILSTLTKSKPQPEINIILLIALYEINYTKKPIHAITNDLVNLSYTIYKNIKIKNFVNAVIRNFIRNKLDITEKLSDNLEYVYNFPLWLINKVQNDYPDNWKNILETLNTKPNISLRINPHKTTIEDYTKYLDNDKIKYNVIDNIIVLEETISVKNIPLFSDGFVSIQDINAQKINRIIQFKKDQYVLDACSAPGGKTCQILENNKVDLLALDIDKNRLDKVNENLLRLDLKAEICCANANKLDWWNGKKFDVIIADLPCSASGTIKRNPDIKIHRQKSDIQNFVDTQRSIVLNLWSILKDNGLMLYITCSIFKEENQENINFLRKKLPNFKVIKELQLLPDINGDGFYYCLLKKEINHENI